MDMRFLGGIKSSGSKSKQDQQCADDTGSDPNNTIDGQHCVRWLGVLEPPAMGELPHSDGRNGIESAYGQKEEPGQELAAIGVPCALGLRCL